MARMVVSLAVEVEDNLTINQLTKITEEMNTAIRVAYDDDDAEEGGRFYGLTEVLGISEFIVLTK